MSIQKSSAEPFDRNSAACIVTAYYKGNYYTNVVFFLNVLCT